MVFILRTNIYHCIWLINFLFIRNSKWIKLLSPIIQFFSSIINSINRADRTAALSGVFAFHWLYQLPEPILVLDPAVGNLCLKRTANLLHVRVQLLIHRTKVLPPRLSHLKSRAQYLRQLQLVTITRFIVPILNLRRIQRNRRLSALHPHTRLSIPLQTVTVRLLILWIQYPQLRTVILTNFWLFCVHSQIALYDFWIVLRFSFWSLSPQLIAFVLILSRLRYPWFWKLIWYFQEIDVSFSI